jgi:hypothetical protein
MKGNYEEFKERAVELINNHAGFLPGQESNRVLHAQFTLAEIFNLGYKQALLDNEKLK